MPWGREWQATPLFLSGYFHGQNSSWDCKESDTTEQLTLQCFSSLSMRKNLKVWKYMKTTQIRREAVWSLLRNQVNYHHLYLEDSKTGKRVGKVYGEKKKNRNFRYAFIGDSWNGKVGGRLNKHLKGILYDWFLKHTQLPWLVLSWKHEQNLAVICQVLPIWG